MSTHIQCPQCFFHQASFYDYCGHCGFCLSHTCPSCQKKNPETFRFCGFCGYNISQNTPTQPLVRAQEPTLPTTQLPKSPTAPKITLAPESPLAQSAVARMKEQRTVTIVFCDICGFTAMSEKLDAEDVSNIIQPLFEQISAVIHKYEGIIEKFIGDAIMALFGVPHSHEDDPERALLASLEIREIVQAYRENIKVEYDVSMNMRIGVNTGDVVAGSVGKEGPRGQTVMGDAINTAARVEQNARPGNILVTEAVYQLTQDNFDFEPREDIVAKGKAEPLKVYEVVAFKKHQQRSRGFAYKVPFVGRQEELKALKNLSTPEKKAVFIGVRGDAGQGKSRLLKEWLKDVQKEKNNVLIKGGSTSYSRRFSFFLLQNLLKNIMSIPERTPRDEALNIIENSLKALKLEKSEQISRALEYVLYPDTPPDTLQYLPAERLKTYTFQALVHFFVAIAQSQRLLLILEDIHWADPMSLEWVNFFHQWIQEQGEHEVIVAATWRQEMPSEQEAQISTLPWNTVVDLQPLSSLEAITLINAVLQEKQAPADLGELYAMLIERSECNPYYIEEVLKALLQTQSLVHTAQGWQLTHAVKKLPWPSSLKNLTVSHFDRLPATEREVLQMAAVIGMQFSAEMIAELLDIDHQSLKHLLGSLVQRGYLWGEPQQEIYGFKKSLVSDVIYSSLLKKHKRQLHESIGLYIEENLFPEQAGEVIEPLAMHFSKTHEHLKALRYLYLAGQKSARMYANQQALDYYHQMLEILSTEDLASDKMVALDIQSNDWRTLKQVFLCVAEAKIEIFWLTGEYDKALELSEQALASLDAFSTLHQSRIYLYRGKIYEKRSQWEQALEELAKGKACLERHPNGVEMARLLNAEGWVLYRKKDYKLAKEAAESALVLLKDRPNLEEIAYAHNILGVVNYQKNQWEDALASYEKSLAYQEKTHDEWGMANSLSNMGSVFVMTNQWLKARDHFVKSLEIRERLGDVAGVATSCNNLGHIYQQTGENTQALEVIQKALNLYLKLNNKFGYAIAYCNLGLVNLKLGNWQSTTDNLSKGVGFLKELNADEVLPEAVNGLIESSLQQELLTEAHHWISDVKEAVKKYGDPIQKGRYERLKALFYFKKQQYKKTLSYLNKARTLLEPTAHTLECLYLYHQFYQCHLALNDADKADMWLRDFEVGLKALSESQRVMVQKTLLERVHSK